VLQVPVAPVQRPQPAGLGVMQAGDGEPGPVKAGILAPRRWHSQMSDVVGRHRIRSGSRHERVREPGRRTSVVRGRRRAREVHQRPCRHDGSRDSHRLRSRSSIGFVWAGPNASAGVAQSSTRRGRWLSFATTEQSSSLVNIDTSAFLCRYWRSSRFVFSLVPQLSGMVRVAEEHRHRQRSNDHRMVSHLPAPVPGQRPPQMRWQPPTNPEGTTTPTSPRSCTEARPQCTRSGKCAA
jgi:hypothetical protein